MGEEDTSQVDASGIHHYLVKPGFIYFTRGAAIVTAVLGNSVSVCLWDKRNRQGGMNNFLYPFTKNKSGTTAKYGNVATVMLIKMMEDAGSLRKDLVAQIFGGGHPSDQQYSGKPNIGQANVEAARKVLSRRRIKVVSEDVGGHLGRKIAFEIETGNVAVLRVHDIRESDWHFSDDWRRE